MPLRRSTRRRGRAEPVDLGDFAPIRRIRPIAPPPAPSPFEPIPEPEVEDVGALRRYLAMGARGVGGFAGFTPVSGAIGGGLGELVGELLEGSDVSPSRIITEGAIGAAGGGFAKNFARYIGKPLAAGARGALLGGSAPVVRSVVEGEEINPYDVAIGGAVGGATAGGLSTLLGKLNAKLPKQPTTSYQIETTAQPGGSVLTGGKSTPGKYVPGIGRTPSTTGGKLQPSVGPGTIYGRGNLPAVAPPTPLPSALGAGGEDLRPLLDLMEGPPSSMGRVPIVGGTGAEHPTAIRDAAAAVKAKEKADLLARKAAEKAAEEAAGRARIREAIAAHGMEPLTPTISEGVSTPIPGGQMSLRQRWGVPEETEDVAEGSIEAIQSEIAALKKALSAPQAPPTLPPAPMAPPVSEPTPFNPPRMAPPERVPAIPEGIPSTPSVAPAAPISTEAPDLLTRIQRLGQVPTKPMPGEPPQVQAIGAAYDIAKALKATPEASPGTERLRSQLGRLLQQESKVARGGAPATPPVEPTVPPAFTEEARAELRAAVERAKNLGQRPGAWVRQERGEIPTALMTKLGLTAGGAAVGGAMNEEDPLQGALMGGAAGAALGFGAPAVVEALTPVISKFLTRPGEAIDAGNTAGLLGSPEGAMQLGKRFVEYLPQYLRGNYLWSQNMPANVVAGPYGSAYLGALEQALAGDPRGWDVVRNFTPVQFARQFPSKIMEATGMIGRAEGLPFNDVQGYLQHVQATPGLLMTTGDLVARDALLVAGFTEAEARAMTMTSEPTWKTLKKLVDFARSGPLGQTLLPFARTTGNIVERGAERIPGIGFLVNATKDVPDPAKLAAIKQLFGAGSFVAGEQVGERVDPNDPSMKMWRSLTSNIAGQAALPAAAGWAVGQARRRGATPMEMVRTAGMETMNAVPLPTTNALQELLQVVVPAAGQPRRIPRGIIPAVAHDVLEQRGIIPGRPAVRTRTARRARRPRQSGGS